MGVRQPHGSTYCLPRASLLHSRILHALVLFVYLGVSLLLIHVYKQAGGHSSPRQLQSSVQHDKRKAPTHIQTEAPGGPPKVALLFLLKNGHGIPNDAVWRAFFPAAAQLQLQPHVAAAAAEAAQQNSKVTVAAAVGDSMPLHTALSTLPPWEYPSYRLQHGLVPGAKPPPTEPRSLQTTEKVQAAASNSSSVSSVGGSNFPAAAYGWEAGLLQQAAGQLTGPPWDPFGQLSTMHQALAAAAAQGIGTSTDNTTGSLPQEQQHQWHRNHALCLSSMLGGARKQESGTGPQTAASPQQQQQQELFSVYVHTPAGILLPSDSVLSGCELPVRLNTSRGWGQHVLAEAASLLLAAALSDPLNAKFVLVSDTSIPLYPPQVVWAQLMHEPLSRLDACTAHGRDRNTYRWQAGMGTERFRKEHWRKSSQWFGLSRAHALLAVADVHVRESFNRYCYTNRTEGKLCVSDENWLPTLLATYGLDEQTDCEGLIHHADWSDGWGSPKSFKAADLTPELVTYMRAGVQLKLVRQASQEAAQQRSHGANPANASHTPQPPQIAQKELQAALDACNSPHALSSASRLFMPARGASATTQLSVQEASDRSTAHTVTDREHHGGSLQQQLQSEAAGTNNSKHTQSTNHWLVAAGYVPLGQRCAVFARKFPAGEQQAVLAMALSCRGLGLGWWCAASP